MVAIETLTPLDIRPLRPGDAASLEEMLSSSSPNYLQYFKPFAFDDITLRKLLTAARRDQYWGIWHGPQLTAFFMLRGLDQGYEVPSFGVAVAEAHAGRGLLKLSLAFAITWCRLNRISKIMLKVHPANTAARLQYEGHRFEQTSIDPATGHLVYYRDL
jgi:RimJ/RimL family protein N-acetyltransferase